MIRIRYHVWQHKKNIESGSFQVVKLQIATYKYKVHLLAIDGLAVCLSGSFVCGVCVIFFPQLTALCEVPLQRPFLCSTVV